MVSRKDVTYLFLTEINMATKAVKKTKKLNEPEKVNVDKLFYTFTIQIICDFRNGHEIETGINDAIADMCAGFAVITEKELLQGDQGSIYDSMRMKAILVQHKLLDNFK